MMFAFLRKKKMKKITSDKENAAFVSSGPPGQSPSAGRIHVDTRPISSDKLPLISDSNESSPRNGCHSSSHQSSSMTHATTRHLGPTDLNRVLTSGYLNGEKDLGYMKRGTGDHIASSTTASQFHRPIGFSYNRTKTFAVANQKKGMKALVTGQMKVRKVHCSHSSSPEIVLSRYSGGFIPDPTAPKKIESLDWPAPIAIQAVPELMRTHRCPSESPSIPDITQLKDSSGMAHALLEKGDVPLDPWKASRSPSAAVEPPQRCRFDSPKFASPSRRVYTHSSSTTQPDDIDSAIHVSLADSEPSTHSAPAQLTHLKVYSYDELKVRSNKRLPSDVGRGHLERHLSDDEFQRVFHMQRSDFYRLPDWRRVDLKKRLKLF